MSIYLAIGVTWKNGIDSDVKIGFYKTQKSAISNTNELRNTWRNHFLKTKGKFYNDSPTEFKAREMGYGKNGFDLYILKYEDIIKRIEDSITSEHIENKEAIKDKSSEEWLESNTHVFHDAPFTETGFCDFDDSCHMPILVSKRMTKDGDIIPGKFDVYMKKVSKKVLFNPRSYTLDDFSVYVEGLEDVGLTSVDEKIVKNL